MRWLIIIAALVVAVSPVARAQDVEPQVPAKPKIPGCHETTVPYLVLSYEARTLAKTDIAGTAIRARRAELQTLAESVGVTKLDVIGNNYTAYNETNISTLQCNVAPPVFKPGETIVQVKTTYDIAPPEKLSAFSDLLLSKGFVPSVTEMKRTVCE